MTGGPIALRVNGVERRASDVPASERLLDTLRWRFDLKGTKEGCRTGGCGACTVLVDGESTLSCLTLTHEVDGRAVATIEAGDESPTMERVRAAFAAEGALQCGYCTPGFVVALTGLLEERGRAASRDEMLEALAGNLCRCTGYAAIGRAVERLREEAP
jgi:aerobic-type carbon monoxide dehydrogenase small subunit (CoxS/CutS family)